VGHHHQAKANTSGPTTKAHRKAGRADHRSQNANLEVRRWSAVRATIVFARRQSDKPFWPLGLCIAWLMSQDLVQAVKLFARLRLGLQYDRDEWATARTKLMNRLGEGRIQAFGLPPRERKRIEISAVEWMDSVDHAARRVRRGPPRRPFSCISRREDCGRADMRTVVLQGFAVRGRAGSCVGDWNRGAGPTGCGNPRCGRGRGPAIRREGTAGETRNSSRKASKG
jgi:hypothetical protein